MVALRSRVALEIERAQRRVGFQRHSKALGQMPAPRIDPDVVGRPGQQAIEDAARHEDAVEELQQDTSDGAGAAFFRAHRDERAGHPLPEVSAVVFRPRLRPDEIPERLRLEFRGIAFLATGRKPQHPRDEERYLLVRDVEIVEQCDERGPEIVQRFREARDPHRVDPARAGKEDSRGLHEVVRAARAAIAERDSAHRVDDVFVEAREETEPVLAGQILASAGARTRDRHAPRFAAERGLPFVDGDREPALGQFVGGAETADAATEHGNRLIRSWSADDVHDAPIVGVASEIVNVRFLWWR